MSTQHKVARLIDAEHVQALSRMQMLSPNKMAERLAEEGLLAPEPHIIRTVEELAALDQETVICSSDGTATQPIMIDQDYGDEWLPAVVLVTGEQVRAARQALEKEQEKDNDSH